MWIFDQSVIITMDDSEGKFIKLPSDLLIGEVIETMRLWKQTDGLKDMEEAWTKTTAPLQKMD